MRKPGWRPPSRALTSGLWFSLVGLAVLLPACPCVADSIFDIWGLGQDVIPVAGPTRALGGAVVANPDPIAASIANPCAAARARSLMLTGGLVHTSTSTDNLGESKTTVGSLFPSVGVVIPFGQFSILTGLYVDKMGSVNMAEADTLLPESQSSGAGVAYQASYKRETSVHSVPVFISRDLYGRLILSAGVVLAFCDVREETALDFSASGYVDTDDVMDTHATGNGFAAALLVDLGRLSLGGLYRSGPDLSGSIEKKGKFAGVWQDEDVTISSHDALKMGLRASPLTWVSVELDYDRCPWSKLTLDGEALSNKLVERWALGVSYTGNHLWRASKYPLALGYYRQPADWQDAEPVAVPTGEILEEAYSIGLSIPLAKDRAAMCFAFEAGTRAAEAQAQIDGKSDRLEENFYRVSLSVSAMEVWRRSIKR